MWDIFWAIMCICFIVMAILFLLIFCAAVFGVVVVLINIFTGKLEKMSKRIIDFIS